MDCFGGGTCAGNVAGTKNGLPVAMQTSAVEFVATVAFFYVQYYCVTVSGLILFVIYLAKMTVP